MSTYAEIYYHLVWATKGRNPSLTDNLRPRVYAFIRHKCSEVGAFVHALGGVEDHVHLAVSVPPLKSVADFMESVKGASSHFINAELRPVEHFTWQRGYGVLTFARRDLPRVVAYIHNQRLHHSESTTWPSLERVADRDAQQPAERGSHG